MDSFIGGVDVHRFAEKNLGVFLAAENRAQGRSDFAGREGAGGDLVEERLEEVEVALIDEGDLGVGAFQSARGYQAAETAAEDDDAMLVGHEIVVRILEENRWRKGAEEFLGERKERKRKAYTEATESAEDTEKSKAKKSLTQREQRGRRGNGEEVEECKSLRV